MTTRGGVYRCPTIVREPCPFSDLECRRQILGYPSSPSSVSTARAIFSAWLLTGTPA